MDPMESDRSLDAIRARVERDGTEPGKAWARLGGAGTPILDRYALLQVVDALMKPRPMDEVDRAEAHVNSALEELDQATPDVDSALEHLHEARAEFERCRVPAIPAAALSPEIVAALRCSLERGPDRRTEDPIVIDGTVYNRSGDERHVADQRAGAERRSS